MKRRERSARAAAGMGVGLALAASPAVADPAAARMLVAASPSAPSPRTGQVDDDQLAFLAVYRGVVSHVPAHTSGGMTIGAAVDYDHARGHDVERLAIDGGLGGGGADVEGAISAAWLRGLRWSDRDASSPYLRVGAEASLVGNDLLYRSRVLVPELEVGHQWLRDAKLAETAFYAGPTLSGDLRIGDRDRHLGPALTYGTRLRWRDASLERRDAGGVLFSLDANLTTSGNGFHDQPADVLGRLCDIELVFAVCFDARLVHTTAATAEQLGLSVGLGLAD